MKETEVYNDKFYLQTQTFFLIPAKDNCVYSDKYGEIWTGLLNAIQIHKNQV